MQAAWQLFQYQFTLHKISVVSFLYPMQLQCQSLDFSANPERSELQLCHVTNEPLEHMLIWPIITGQLLLDLSLCAFLGPWPDNIALTESIISTAGTCAICLHPCAQLECCLLHMRT